VYVVNQFSLNAATYGTNDDSFILLHSALIDHLSDEELVSVIGHECGHIHNSHVVYLTALHYLRVMASMFLRWIATPATLALNAWARRAEVTCDRAGLLCTRDLEVSTRALAKLALGSTKLYEQLNLEAFVDQYEEGRQGIGAIAEVMATHPWLPKRVKALRLFAQSRLYREHIGQQGGLRMEQVDERVHDIIKILG
jgi:Zn-dependent protease with chaperone function